MWLPDGTAEPLFTETDYGECFGIGPDGATVLGRVWGEAFMSDFDGNSTNLGKLHAGAPFWSGS